MARLVRGREGGRGSILQFAQWLTRTEAGPKLAHEPSREGAPGGPGMPGFGFPLPPLKFRTVGFPQYGFKWTVNGDLRRHPKA
jgi:hypothetical protein